MAPTALVAGISGASVADNVGPAGYGSEHLFGSPVRPRRPGAQTGVRVLVLGVDPGLTRCGIGLVRGQPGHQLDLVGFDVVHTPAVLPLGDRLVQLADAIESWLVSHQPDAVAVEALFSQRNVRTVMGTAQASGVVIATAARRGVPITLHTPSEVKAAVTGNGRADKAQVATMVTRLLRLTAAPRPADAADALALAICHVWRSPVQARLAAAALSRP